MNITTLIENKPGNHKGLYVEHGISVYIEKDEKNILFDTGQSGKFIDNAKKLDIDLKKLDYVIISHGHYDHSGGFERLIKEINPNIRLYVESGFFNKKYNLRKSGEYKYVGNLFDANFLESNNIKTKYIHEDIINITENIFIFNNFHKDKEFENINETMYLKINGNYEKDKFTDEIALGINTSKGLVIMVGCSHIGIVNILDTIIQRTNKNIHALIGGTHLIREDDEKINKVIKYLKEKDVKVIGACHCTGKQGKTMLRQQLEENFINNNTGDVFKM